jgi:DNA invertase Pin-like site-specific DNA recombinase
MTIKKPQTVRCAIYTRVSTDQGLDQGFNSLDAQYEASRAYIRSQAHAGWSQIRARYDDGGFSGGNTDRPALQQLQEDIRARKIDVIVVYKVDRLTRSLADFAKLVELFDQHDVSFVSVTQQFNTTTSMGRLTLNVLLSFAQFEREVTSERIRDKIAASKRKGLWVGGLAPLGYDSKDRKISVNEKEAETVRTIFRRYLELGSLSPLLADLRRQGITTKRRVLSFGKIIGGIPFTRGPLAHLLRNRFYIGEVPFKGEILPGEQLPILDRGMFDAVQAKLTEQLTNHIKARVNSEALLMGRIIDDRGNPMRTSHALKAGIKYRYYVSSALVDGRQAEAGSVPRVPAVEIETLVAGAIREHIGGGATIDDRTIVAAHQPQIVIHPNEITIRIGDNGDPDSAQVGDVIRLRWQKQSSKRRREVLLPASAPHADDKRPIRSETRATLIAAIARGRRWLDELVRSPDATAETIAQREGCSPRKVTMTMSLAFLSPALVKAALEGRLPRGVGVTRLCDMPAEWSRQHQALGLNL